MKTKIYFPGLNGIRFLASMAVLFCHAEMNKHCFGLPNLYADSFVGGVLGDIGVILFFVLSGFLITYLLLAENHQFGTINIRHFYVRRILRIWPLYYLIVIVSLFILPQSDFFYVPGDSETVQTHLWPKAILFLAFLPNIPYALYDHVPFANQSWSIGVEEQYYLIWPAVILLSLRYRKLLFALLATGAIYLLVKALIIFSNLSYPGGFDDSPVFQFWFHFNIDCMAIGGIAAYILYYKKQRALRFLFHPATQIATIMGLTYLTLRGILVEFIGFEIYGVLFAVIILNIAANPRSILKLENSWLDYLGKISYGIYMYHNLMMLIALKLIMLFTDLSFGNPLTEALYYVLTIGFTLLISAVSYHGFERRFITLKVRYSPVVSGDNVNQLPSDTPKPVADWPQTVKPSNG